MKTIPLIVYNTHMNENMSTQPVNKLFEDAARSTAHQSRDGSSSNDFADGRSAVSSSASLSVDARPEQQAHANSRPDGESLTGAVGVLEPAVSAAHASVERRVRFTDNDEVHEFVVFEEYEDECVALINEIHDNVERRRQGVRCYRHNGLWPEELAEQRFRRRVRSQLATAQQLYSNRHPRFSLTDTLHSFLSRVLLLNVIHAICAEVVGLFTGQVQDEFILDEDGMPVFDDQGDSIAVLPEVEGETGSEGEPALTGAVGVLEPAVSAAHASVERRVRFTDNEEVHEFVVCQEYEDEYVALINEIHDNKKWRRQDVRCYRLNGLWPEELEEQRRRSFRRRVRSQLATAQQLYSNRQPCFSFANTFYPLFLRVLLLNGIDGICAEVVGLFTGQVQDEFILDEDGMPIFDDQDDSIPVFPEVRGDRQ